MKVAIVHDYLRTYGDAERLLQVLHQMYPQAPIYTAFVDRRSLGTNLDRVADWDIRTTWAQRLPAIAQQFTGYRSLIPYIWESLDLTAYDLVISSSADYLSKAVLTRPETLHVCYCHTPPRPLWEPAIYAPQASWYGRWADTALRQYDFQAAQRVDRFVTNSAGVARRIRKFYRRSVEVIPPPVQIQGDGQAGDQYYLYVGALEPPQQVELAMLACQQIDRPLWIVGTGSQTEQLQQLGGNQVRFLGALPDAQMAGIYAHAKALILPQPDADFAVAAVEAMGYGVPVIAAEQSGIREIVLNFRTGLLFEEPTIASLSATLLQFERLRFFSHACIQRAAEFARSEFTTKLEWLIAQALDEQRSSQSMNAEITP